MNLYKLFLILVLLLPFSGIAMAVTESQQTSIRTALMANDWDTALDLAEDLVDDNPKSSIAHYLLASAIRVKMQDVSQVRAMFSLGDYKEALATAIELDPSNVDARTEEIGFYMMAPGIAGGDKDLAAEKIKALKTVNELKGLEMEAQLAAVNEDNVQAKKILLQILVKSPTAAGVLMQLAVMEMQEQNYRQADDYLLKITAEEDAGWPLLAQYQRAKARVIAKQDSDLAIELLQDYKNKLKTIETTMNLPPESAVLWRMALAYENKQDNYKAIELLEASLVLDKDFEAAENDLERLQN